MSLFFVSGILNGGGGGGGTILCIPHLEISLEYKPVQDEGGILLMSLQREGVTPSLWLEVYLSMISVSWKIITQN